MRIAHVKYKSPWYFRRVCDKLLGIFWKLVQHQIAKRGSGIADL